MGLLFLNLGLATFLLGLIGIWVRMPALGLTTRRRGLVWVGTGVAIMAVSFRIAE